MFSFIGTLLTGGVGIVIFPVVPGVIYWRSRGKDRYVERHALQASVLAAASTVGLLAYILIGVFSVMVMWLVIAILCIILVGLILIPVGVVVTLVFALSVVLYPVVVTVYGAVASYNAAVGKDYQYPYLGHWVEKQRVLAIAARDRAKFV